MVCDALQHSVLAFLKYLLCLSLVVCPGDVGSEYVWSTNVILPDFKVSHPRRQQL